MDADKSKFLESKGWKLRDCFVINEFLEEGFVFLSNDDILSYQSPQKFWVHEDVEGVYAEDEVDQLLDDLKFSEA